MAQKHSHGNDYLRKPDLFDKENRRVFVGGGTGAIILRILRVEVDYRAKAWKIKSIDFVNKPEKGKIIK